MSLPTQEKKLAQKKAVENAAREGFNGASKLDDTGYPTQETVSVKRIICGTMTKQNGCLLACVKPRNHDGAHSWDD